MDNHHHSGKQGKTHNNDMLICFDSDSDLMIHDKDDNEMLISFDSDSELSTPVCATVIQSVTVSQSVDRTECKNNITSMVDTPINVTVYDAKLPETLGWTMTIPINIKGKRILPVVDTPTQATIISEKLIQNLNIPVQPNTSISVRVVGHIQRGNYSLNLLYKWERNITL